MIDKVVSTRFSWVVKYFKTLSFAYPQSFNITIEVWHHTIRGLSGDV